MSINKSRPTTRCSICGLTLRDNQWGYVRDNKEGLCHKCYNKRGRDMLLGKDPYRRRKK